MASSRDAILGALREQVLPAVDAPDLGALGVRFEDPLAQLERAMTAVGGACVRVADLAAAEVAIAGLANDAKRTVSLVPGLAAGSIDLANIGAPHELASLELAILPGTLAVAENGAVWVDGAVLHHRAVFVIADRLVLVVHARDVVHHMHEAYDRLAGRPRGYGLFISGPSKTADIEQVLVVGAQGARTCTLIVIEDAP